MEAAWVALSLSLKVAGWATAINLLLGVGVGYALARWRFPGRDLVDAALTLPMVMPPTVLGYYLLVVIGSQGVVGAWLLEHFGLRLIFTWQAAVIAATIVAFPLVFKAARAQQHRDAGDGGDGDEKIGGVVLPGLHRLKHRDRQRLGFAGNAAGHHQRGAEFTECAGERQQQTGQNAAPSQRQRHAKEHRRF